MNDEQILLALGYTLNEMGAILNKDGNYVESVDYNGRVIESNITKENHDIYISEQEILKEIGFKYDVDAEGGENFQQQVAIAKHHIKKYEEDTLSVVKPNFNDSYYIIALEEIKNDKTTSVSVVKTKPQKENVFADYISIDIVLPIALLSLFIFLILKRRNQMKTFWNQLISRVYKLKILNQYKFYTITISLSLIVSNLLAYKFKKLTNPYYLSKALKKDTKWEHDAYLEMINSKFSFFHLTDVYDNGNSMEIYSYNWEVFIISFCILVGVVIFIRNTIYYDKLSQFFNSIKRTD